MQKVIFLTLFLFGCWQAHGQDYLKEANACFEQGDYECAKKNYGLFQIWDGKDMCAEIKNADECFKTLIVADNYFSGITIEHKNNFFITVNYFVFNE